MNHFSYPLTIVQINIVEEPQNIFFPIVIPDPILSSQPSRIFNPRVPPPPSLLVSNTEDNSLPGDLTIIFSKSLISCMRLHVYPVTQNWFPMSKMSNDADCRGSKLITPDYYWLWFFCMSLAFHGCTSCYFSILFALITLTSSKSESQSEAV